MNRRSFLHLCAGAYAATHFPRTAFADETPASLHLTLRPDRLGNRIGEDFTGLSYESAQLGNAEFFAGDNVQLAGFVRRLGASGVLRIGGNTSEYCYWTPGGATQAGNAEAQRVVGPDKGLKAPPPVKITPQAIRNLREFLDVTGWKLIYGLNMGTGTAELCPVRPGVAALFRSHSGPRPKRTIRGTGYSLQQRVAGALREEVQSAGELPVATLLRGGSAHRSFDDPGAFAAAQSEVAGGV